MNRRFTGTPLALLASFAVLTSCTGNDTGGSATGPSGGSATTSMGGSTDSEKSATTSKNKSSSSGGSSTEASSSTQGGSSNESDTTSVGGASKTGSSKTGDASSKGGASTSGDTKNRGGSSATSAASGIGGSSKTAGTNSKGGSTSNGGTSAGGGSSTTSAGGGSSTSTSGETSAHMYTKGSDLYTHCGEKVLLRGVNQMSVWTDASGSSYPAIASFGSNAIRIVYQTSGTASGLDTLLSKAEENKMIAMPELHDATGKFDGVAACVNWWVQPDVVAVVKKHEKWTLLNIANEAGDSNVSNATFQSTYTSAITKIRDAGISVPIVIDGTGWGQNVEQLLAVAPALLDADPQKNVIFSWHEYTGGTQENARITTSYEKSKSLGIVLINGEFASGGAGTCTENIPYKHLLAEAQRVGIGWLAWSWDTGNSDCKSGGKSIFDMTTDLISASAVVAGWPADVMRDDPNSIKNTSVRHCEWK